MKFHVMNLEKWERKTHYEAYTTFLPMHWNITVKLDLSVLLSVLAAEGLRLYPAMLYLASTAINAMPEFRMAYDTQGNLGYYDSISPSYTIFHEQDHTFSDIWTAYQIDFKAFYEAVVQDMTDWKDVRGYHTKPNRPQNCVPMSMVPWLAFESCAFDTPKSSKMLLPVLTFGKYTKQEENRYTMPLSIFANHAVADGWHCAQLVEKMQQLADTSAVWIKS